MTVGHDNKGRQESGGKIAPAGASLAAALAAMLSRLPALGAWWNQDDWGLLARAAGLIDDPGAPARWLSRGLYWQAMWPLAGLDPAPYAVSRILLHALAAAGTARLAARLGLTTLQQWAAGMIMAASPLAFGPLYWAAGVQDLLAVCCLVWALERWRRGGAAGVAMAVVLGAVALAAKEVVAGLPLLLLMMGTGDAAERRPPRAWSLAAIAVVALAALAALAAALDVFGTGAGQPYALGSAASSLGRLLVYGWWLMLPGPVFHPQPHGLMAAAGALMWLAWAVWAVTSWRSGARVPGLALAGALLMLLPLLPLARHLSPDLAYPVEPFGCLALAALIPARWRPRGVALAVMTAAALAWGYGGMQARLHLRGDDGLHADPVVRRTAVSWQACRELEHLPLPADGLVMVQPPLTETTAAMAADLGEGWVTGSTLYHALEGSLGPRLVLGPDVPVVWANGLRRTPRDALVLLDAGARFKPWGPTRQALLNQVLTDVGAGLFDRARLHLLRASLLAGDSLALVFDPDVLPVPMTSVLANAESFLDHLAAGRGRGRSPQEIAGLQENFRSLLAVCTGDRAPRSANEPPVGPRPAPTPEQP